MACLVSKVVESGDFHDHLIYLINNIDELFHLIAVKIKVQGS